MKIGLFSDDYIAWPVGEMRNLTIEDHALADYKVRLTSYLSTTELLKLSAGPSNAGGAIETTKLFVSFSA